MMKSPNDTIEFADITMALRYDTDNSKRFHYDLAITKALTRDQMVLILEMTNQMKQGERPELDKITVRCVNFD